MPLNKDGLEAGQPVDFSTLMRVKRQQEAKDAKPKQRVSKNNRKGLHDTSSAVLPEATQEAQRED